MNNVKNFRNDEQLALKQANNAWSNCVAQNFLPQWLKGDKLSIEEVCQAEWTAMKELDDTLYAETPMPFKSAL